MVRVKAFAEVELYMELELEGIDAASGDHEVQARRPDLLQAIQAGLDKGFGGGNWELISFEYDVVRSASSGTA